MISLRGSRGAVILADWRQNEPVLVRSEEEMLSLGESLAEKMKPGVVVLLSGELGAGKTTLVRGVMSGLGHKGEVRSPTFNVVHEYTIEPPVCHVDLYRLDGVSGLGLEGYFSTHAMFVEWPERAPGFFPEDAWLIRIKFVDGGREVAL